MCPLSARLSRRGRRGRRKWPRAQRPVPVARRAAAPGADVRVGRRSGRGSPGDRASIARRCGQHAWPSTGAACEPLLSGDGGGRLDTAVAPACGDTVTWKSSERIPLISPACGRLPTRATEEVGAPRDVHRLLLGDRAIGEQQAASASARSGRAPAGPARRRTAGRPAQPPPHSALRRRASQPPAGAAAAGAALWAPAALSTETVERAHAASWPEGLEEGCRDHRGRDQDRNHSAGHTMFTMWMCRWTQGT